METVAEFQEKIPVEEVIESIEPLVREKIESVEIPAPKEPLDQEPTVSIEPKDTAERKELHELHVREKIVSTGIIMETAMEDTLLHVPLEPKKPVRIELQEATELHVCVIIVPVQQAIHHPAVQEAIGQIAVILPAVLRHILPTEVVEVIHPAEAVTAEVHIRHLADQEVLPVIVAVEEVDIREVEEGADKIINPFKF